MNKMLVCLVCFAMTTTAFSQSGSRSPYSQYGLGDLVGQGGGFNKGMNGVGIAMRMGNEVNPLNPAAYSAIDSLTMIFDGGLYGQITNFEENGTKVNEKSGGFDYFTTLFRVRKNMGVSVGVLPYSNVGYEYTSKETVSMGQGDKVTEQSTYRGKGGLSQLYIGWGWRIIKPLSIGVNLSYLWGDINRQISVSTDHITNTLYRFYDVSVSNYKVDFGVQLALPIGQKDFLTVGATFSPGHKLNSDPTCQMVMSNSLVSQADTTAFKISNGIEIPNDFGLGLAYSHAGKFRVGADFRLQKWGSVAYPEFDGFGYNLKDGLLKDRTQVNVGAEFMPNPASRKLLGHVRFRAGVGYATPYYYINGQEGPKELSASIGLGIPIANAYNNRSVLNISGQYVQRSADNLLTENTFRICIGLTFNERWFAKWKVE